MRDLERRLGALPPEARRLLELRLQRGKEEAASAPVRRGATRAPLSFAQRRMWFLDRLEPGALYNSPLALRVRGALDAGALEGALAEVVRRHESLRSVIRAETGAEAEQVVLPPGPFLLPADDLSALPAAAREDEARRIVHDEVRRPFDLAAGPLLRARLLRLADEEHVLVLAMHHVVSDGWSLGVLFRELGALYAAFSRGAEAPLEPLPLQYADYAAWQREHWTEERLAAQLEWWRRALDGAPAVLELPADRPRPAVQSHRGARLRFALPHALAEGVRALARREGATPFMVMLAAFDVLLWRWSGEEDLVVGSPVAGRTRAETEGLIGFFVNTLPLRVHLGGNPTFATLLHRVRQATLGAYEHQDLPFERLVEALHPGRSLRHAPVFQTLFALQNATPAELRLPGVVMELMPTEAGTARFDLEWMLWEREEGITGAIDYAADLFDAATVERMAGRYRRILEAAVARPDTRISVLPLLDAAEAARIAAWQAGPTLPPAIPLFPAQLAARVAEAPDAVALVHGDVSLTRAELDARANRLARHLRRLGVGPETIVGVAMERTPELIVTLLAVLKAGGAYVPMEPHFPADRIRAVLAASGARVFAASASLIDRIDLPSGCRALAMDDAGVRAAVDAEDSAAPPIDIHPENLSHVIYTSGSTGTPKGVMIRHGSVAALVTWMRERFPLRPGERVLHASSISFDVQLAEVHFPLATGAPILMLHDTLALAELPAGEPVAQASMVATAARELLALGRIPAGLRRLNQGGEAMPADLVSGLYAAGVAEVHNCYGPTEDTTYSTQAHLAADGRVTIGRPLAGRRAYVLDGALRPVPVGMPGDLYLAGCGVARGYLARPDLTAERFLPDPFGAPGERMYASGDRARWVESAEARECESAEVDPAPESSRTDALTHSRTAVLEYLGRADLQVKVRGFRIEPGEVESVLRAHPSVADAVVAAHGTELSRRLAAWVVAREGESIDVAALAAHAKARLPGYMVPAAFTVVDAFPRTVSEKIDRNALPAPDFAEQGAEYVPPRTETERTVAEVFAQVLGVDRVGAADDFFTLGGHSLLAMHVWAHLRDRCGAELSLRALFEHPTVAALAAVVEAAPRAEAAVRITPRTRDAETEIEIVPRGRVRAYAAPVSFSQQRLWMLDRMDPGRATYAVPLALRLRGTVDVDALRRSFDALAVRHESLRTVFRWMDGGPMQVVLPQGTLPVESTDLSSLDADTREAELRRRLRDEASRPFDLEHGPLARVRLYVMAAREHVLLINLHHVVTDGWSTGVLLRDLAALYGAFSRGAPSPLAPPELQYADYAAWQRDRLRGAVYDEQLAYWRRALAGAPVLLELPSDRPRPPVWEGGGAAERFRLPRPAADAVEALARAEGCTPFMVLLAAFQALLGRYARQENVVVGTPVANRGRPETRDVVGFFVNTLALRGDLSGDPPFRALLHRVRDGALGAFAHQEMPFERLVDELKVPRSAGHAPVFQVMFSLQTADDGATPLPGLEVERVSVAATHAPFDLTLTLRPGEAGMDGALEYATALFDRDTALRMIGHFRTLLAAACASPDARLSALPLMADDEVDAALRAWEGPALDSPPATIHARIAQQAARTPNAVAVVDGDAAVTYAELEDRAGRLAGRLRALGVRRGALVGVRAERSANAVAAILAILKAGGAYLPLDPSYPADRQAYMLADSGAALLLDTTGAGAPAGYAGRVVDLAELAASESSVEFLDKVAETGSLVVNSAAGPAISESSLCFVDEVADISDSMVDPAAELTESESSPQFVDEVADPADLAYVIYTSGSTGKPRGVAVPHHCLSAYVDAARQAYGLTSTDRFLQFAPLSFDSSVEELFAPLAAGAAMVLRDAEMLESVDGFWRACAHRELTVASLPTAYWHEIAAAMDHAAPPAPPSLRIMIVGGERALPERVAQWRRGVGGRIRLINSYGPTETTVAATLHTVDADDAIVPIGRPMPGYQVRVLDASLRPVPAGVPGELFVGGVGVARGYLHRPRTTAERFVPDPFASTPGARLYATGDLVRWRESAEVRECVSAEVDPEAANSRTNALTHSRTSVLTHSRTSVLTHSRTAVLDFLGRTDDQVKVRGFRIELGEIEAVLRRQPGVHDAVAAVREDAPGDRRLVGYVVAEEGDASIDHLREALRIELPAYMVPSAFVALDALPMTPSGKVDRRALPAPRRAEDEAQAAAPLSQREHAVAAIWREVLGTDAVGPNDNFFDRGGNSLLLIRLAARLQAELGSTFSAVDLFRFPTVRALAAHLDGAGDSRAADAPTGTRGDSLRQGTSRLLNLRKGAAA